MTRLAIPIVILAGAVWLLALADRPAPRADFTMINRGDASTLDPQRMSWLQELRVARLLFEGLVRWDARSDPPSFAAAAADRWEVSSDGRTYTFHVRSDAMWSNGEPVRAGDFVYAWRRALLPETGADYAKLFELIRGGREFAAWRAAKLREFADAPPSARDADALWAETITAFEDLVAVRAPDDRTLIVELEHPAPYFLDLCGLPAFFPVCESVVAPYERPSRSTGQIDSLRGWTKPPVLACNGPFVLESWRFKREMRLSPNPFYWDPDAVRVRSISIPTIDDPGAQVLAFRTGAADWVSDVTASYRGEIVEARRAFEAEHAGLIERLRASGLSRFEIERSLPPDPRANAHIVPAPGTYFWNFNCAPTLKDGRPNPFADARVRRAFAQAIDKEAITRDLRRIGEPAARTLIPPGMLADFRSPDGLGFDPAEARRLLAEAGWAQGAGFPTVELLFNKDGGHDLIAQAIARNWQEHLGVPVSLAQREVKVFRNSLKDGDYMTSRASWFGDYPDPTTFLDANRTGDGNNDRAYSNPRFDALLDRAAAEPDADARLRLLEEAERILVEEDLPFVPLFHYAHVYLYDAHQFEWLPTDMNEEISLFRVEPAAKSLAQDDEP